MLPGKPRAERITEQLSGLYGPLYLLTSQSDALAKKLREGKKDPDNFHLLHNLKTLIDNPADKAIVDQIIGINGQIEKRIQRQVGLLEDGEIPASFFAFLGHYRQVRIAVERVKETGIVPEEIIDKGFESYPRAFDLDVKRGYERLQRERADLGV